MTNDEKITKPKNGRIPLDTFKRRTQLNMLLTFIGFMVYLLGIRPDFFQMDRSPVIGFIQITVTIVGLAILCLGGYLTISGLWRGRPKSIAAQIGIRLVSTGLVIAVFSALADFFGFGSHPYPESLPYLGKWQVLGIQIGENMIAFGFILMIPFPKIRLFPKLPESNKTDRS